MYTQEKNNASPYVRYVQYTNTLNNTPSYTHIGSVRGTKSPPQGDYTYRHLDLSY